MRRQDKFYIVVDDYRGNDNYIDGNIQIFSTLEKVEEFIKKSKEIMKKSKRSGDKFFEYYDEQTIVGCKVE